MTPAPVEALGVDLDLAEGDGGRIRVGRLAWLASERRAAFQYDPAFLRKGLALSPLQLRNGPALAMSRTHPFDGLHGVFADSLPDGWGRLLLDRAFGAVGRERGSITPLDRLATLGGTGVGALSYTPESGRDGSFSSHDLDWFAAEAARIQAGAEGTDVEAMFHASGGAAGARPKIMVLLDGGEPPGLRVDDGGRPRTGEGHWLVKFASRGDAEEGGRIEQAYATMARQAGIEVAPTRLVEGRAGAAHFATRRFDRTNGGGRVHVQTLAAMVGSDFRVPALDYDDFMKATRLVTGSQEAVDGAFARMAFNVVAGNRDDHEKNHAFAMDHKGAWRPTPAYDLTPSDGLGGEHAMSVAGEGRRPGPEHMRRLGAKHGVAAAVMDEALDRTVAAVLSWRRHASQAGLGRAATARVAERLSATASGGLGRSIRIPASAPATTGKARREGPAI